MKTFTRKLSFIVGFLLISALACAQEIYQTIGIIGTATPQEWNSSTPMARANESDPHQWTLTLMLSSGEMKFRANDAWDVNWGSLSFPSGTAERNGPNITVPSPGYYTISFNDVTGNFNFQSHDNTTYATVGLLGSATSNGWDASIPMVKDSIDPHRWTLDITLSQGEVKFRADNSWEVNWGGPAFPSGTAVRNGSNISVSASGDYTVSFNDATGEYDFQINSPEFTTVGIIGDATPNGWNASTPMVKDPSDPHLWTLDITLLDGEVKFRANDSWDVNWGGSDFPSGTAVLNGSNIAVAAGEYSVTFNDVSLAYFFKNKNAAVYETVGIIGSATLKGWDGSTPMKLVSAGDPNNWVLTTYLQVGELKFRANNSWDVNWGGADFPSGTAVLNGANIQIPESSYYTIQFNDLSRVYHFQKITPPSYATVGIIGTATSNGWNSSTPMVLQADGHTWTLNTVKLLHGEAKFRANDSWTVNWGAAAFPSGTGTQDGPNIPVEGGIYNVSFNDVTGDYHFELTGTTTDGIVVLSPALPTADEPVTIIYDASQGVSSLQGSEKVYMHSGVVLSGFDGTAWNNVVGNWGQDDGVGEMTRVEGEENKWQITLPSIREYYNVGEGVPVFRLGMVFRSADGSQTGKSVTDGDIFVNIDAGDYVRFTAPTATEIFGLQGEQVTISAEASSAAAKITLEINDGSGFVTVHEVTNAQSINYDYSITSSVELIVRVTAELEGSTVLSERTINLKLRQPNTIAALPPGTDNGINYDVSDPTKATLVLLAPGKEFVYAIGDFNNWTVSDSFQMNQTPDGEYFWITLDALEPGKEYVYQYWVEGTIKIGDPYADKVADPWNDQHIPSDVYPSPLNYTNTNFGIATVLQTAQTPFVWTYPEVNGGQPAKEDLVIYELLVRDFIGSHSYKDLADTLSYLKRLGVNAIELLPIMEFEGNESWGYNPSYLFAPDKYYGTKNDLKAFINKAHEEGFVVLLDMVLNHQFGQSPMVRMYFDEANGRPSSESPWFNAEATHPFNVGYDFNHETQYTKRYVDDVNRYWLEEYHFDGYRFDLSKGFTQVNNPNDVGAWSAYDQSRIDILKRMTDVIWETDEDAYVIFEHLAVNEEEKVLADYGIMLWGNMNHAYSGVVNGYSDTDLNWSLSSIRSWNQKNLVPYMESHDEERLMVRAALEGQSNGDYDIKEFDVALQRVKLASAFFFPLPGAKMLWQFGELGYDISINYNGRTGNKPIPWGDEDGLNYHEDPERIKLYKATAAIINFVDDYSHVFEEGNFSWTPSGQFRRINASHSEMNVTIAGNFGLTAGTMQPGFQHTGTWYDFFTGRTFTVTSTSQSVMLEPGEFHIYVDEPVEFPERGLVYTPVEIVAPTNLTAVVEEDLTVTLSWDDNSFGETGHVLERTSEDAESFEVVATLNEDVNFFTDSTVIDGVTYQYRVQATSDVKPASGWSDVATADLPLSAPTGLTTSATKREVSLSWSDNSAHESAFVIERAVGHGNHISDFEIIGEVSPNVVSFADANVRPGKNYHYRVYAMDSDEVSDYSNESSIRPANGSSPALVSFYPNPAQSFVTLTHIGDHPGMVHIEIRSMRGIMMKNVRLRNNQSVQVDVSGWPEGIYMVETHSGRHRSREQLVISR